MIICCFTKTAFNPMSAYAIRYYDHVAPALKCSGHRGCNHGDVMVQQQVTRSPMAGGHPPVPHATFGVIVVEEVPQVDPLHFQSCLEDPATENRDTVYLGFILDKLYGSGPQTFLVGLLDEMKQATMSLLKCLLLSSTVKWAKTASGWDANRFINCQHFLQSHFIHTVIL